MLLVQRCGHRWNTLESRWTTSKVCEGDILTTILGDWKPELICARTPPGYATTRSKSLMRYVLWTMRGKRVEWSSSPVMPRVSHYERVGIGVHVQGAPRCAQAGTSPPCATATRQLIRCSIALVTGIISFPLREYAHCGSLSARAAGARVTTRMSTQIPKLRFESFLFFFLVWRGIGVQIFVH